MQSGTASAPLLQPIKIAKGWGQGARIGQTTEVPRERAVANVVLL